MLRAVHPVLMARDVAESTAFFERLGFALLFADAPVQPRYAAVSREGVTLHLQWQDAAQFEGGRDRPTYRFLVDDVDALFAEFEGRLRGSGALAEPLATPQKIAQGPFARPTDSPWGTREFHLHDPAGNGLQFYRPR
jgi:catechol 2,3-dioxygenase-like lactoylglutathione lyase family enzyme